MDTVDFYSYVKVPEVMITDRRAVSHKLRVWETDLKIS